MSHPKVRIIASGNTWMEGDAIRQLEATAEFPGMRACVGMPDLHPSKGSPNGAAFLSEIVYPSLIGNDSGCGIGLWATDIIAHKAKLDRLVERLNGLDEPWDGDTAQWLADRNVQPTNFDASLGTPGHGNHFIELQQVVDVMDTTLFASLGMSSEHLCLTVHSGSRGFGEAILHEYVKHHGASGIRCESAEGQDYLKQNSHAVAWASANRDLCAHRTLNVIHGDGTRVLDICHNSVTGLIVDDCQCWLHRKGAAPADQGIVLIPGSRGDLSYLVRPVEGRVDALFSLAHGAGRKISRGDAQGKLATLYRTKDIRQNRWGGRLICGERQLLMEEAPECYKDIATVIDNLVAAGLVHVIAMVRPLVTFKTSEGAEQASRQDRKQWQKERTQARDAKRKYR